VAANGHGISDEFRVERKAKRRPSSVMTMLGSATAVVRRACG
jgi:hypothetical protein